MKTLLHFTSQVFTPWCKLKMHLNCGQKKNKRKTGLLKAFSNFLQYTESVFSNCGKDVWTGTFEVAAQNVRMVLNVVVG